MYISTLVSSMQYFLLPLHPNHPPSLQSAPISILENHELASIVIDYKRECGRDSVLQSHTTVHTDCTSESGETTLHCEHLLSLESGPTMVKARTMWRSKRINAQETVVSSSL
jgi:fatty acyl-ACP thioesterase B